MDRKSEAVFRCVRTDVVEETPITAEKTELTQMLVVPSAQLTMAHLKPSKTPAQI